MPGSSSQPPASRFPAGLHGTASGPRTLLAAGHWPPAPGGRPRCLACSSWAQRRGREQVSCPRIWAIGASTTGLDLHDLEAHAVPEVVPACVGLVLAAPCGPVKPVVNGVAVVSGEVEQAPDLADGEPGQAAGPACGGGGGVLWSCCLFWVVCAVRSLWLSTGGGSLF